MPEKTTQLAVIGAGPGGYAAAFLAADLGLSVPVAYGLLSGALLLGSLAAPAAGRMIDDWITSCSKSPLPAFCSSRRMAGLSM